MRKTKNFTAILLAAGKGLRMNSPLAKVLHPVAGQPMIHRIINSLQNSGAKEIRVTVGFSEALVRQVVKPLGAICFKQELQKGTADAVKAAQIESLEGLVMILNGDHPLIEATDIENLIQEHMNNGSDLSIVTSQLKNPASFGRIVRDSSGLRAIVEVKDASAQTLKINEVNTGIYLCDAKILKEYLPRIQNNNQKKEYYLTDLVSTLVEDGRRISGIQGTPKLAFGVNSQKELSKATKIVFQRKIQSLQENGVVIIDPKATYIEDDVSVGAATVIYPGVYLRSGSQIGKFCVIEPNCYVVKSTLEDSVCLRAGSYLEEARVATKAVIGPYARLRPQTNIGEEARVGNFVEMKKVRFGKGAKASHLTYLGDATVGEGTNIGCGTITCNYAVDKKKYDTNIGKNVFVGSDTQFVAPVDIGDDAVIGSGSTITKDVPAKALAIARSQQLTKENYVPKNSPNANPLTKEPKSTTSTES